MKLVRWALLNGAFYAIVLAGVLGVAAMWNLVTFMIWFWLLMCVLGVWAIAEEWYYPDEPVIASVPKWLDLSYDVLVTSTLVVTGHWFYGALYVVTMFAQAVFIELHHRATGVK